MCAAVGFVGLGCKDEAPEAPAALLAPDGMVAFAAGCFPMGSPDHEGDRHEWPRHAVQLTAFALDRTPVTRAAYAAFLREHGNDCAGHACLDCDDADTSIDCDTGYTVRSECQAQPNGPPTATCDDHPAVEVTWWGAAEYCAARGQRLPTEAEWERAANGPGGEDCTHWRRYPWGDGLPESFYFDFYAGTYLDADADEPTWTPQTARANCVDADCFDGFTRTSPVGWFGSRGASAEGVHDLLGNVFEWVQDAHHASYEGAPADGSAWIEGGRGRIRRGGGFYSPGRTLRGAYRAWDREQRTYDFVGFRCATSL